MPHPFVERRNTYHDQWYKVDSLRPRLRAGVGVRRRSHQGKAWYILSQPDSNAHFRLSDELYAFVALMDGKRSMDEIWRLNQEQATDPLTQGEVLSLLGRLQESGLLFTDTPVETGLILQRRQERLLKKIASTVMSFLFLRIPLWTPDRFFTRFQNVGGLIFRPGGFCLWLVLLGLALHALVVNWSAFMGEARLTLAPGNIIWIYVVVVLAKIVHEFGHGFACKYFSAQDGLHGEVNTLGVMFLFFVPVPYVDVSSSVQIRSRFSRAAIALAGVYAELFLAFGAMLVWAQSAPGTGLHILARNCVIITSISTILFNINPLLRFDGYFVFSDLADFPNLYQRAQTYTLYCIKRYLLGVTTASTVVTALREKRMYPVYAVAAFIYRLLITAGIFFILEGTFFLLGYVLACALAFVWFGVPLIKGAAWLVQSPELAGMRARVQLRFLGVASLLLFLLLGVPVESAVLADSVVESRSQRLIYAEVEGLLMDFARTDMAVVQEESMIAMIANPEMEARLKAMRLTIAIAEAKMHLAQSEGNVDAAGQLMLELAGLRSQGVTLAAAAARQRMTAPVNGIWLAPDLSRRRGKWVRKGDLLGVVYTPHDVRIRAVVDQFDAARIFAESVERIEVVLAGRPDLAAGLPFAATLESAPVQAGRRELFHPSLSQQAGGNIAATEQGGRLMAAEHMFELRLIPEDRARQAMLPGETAQVRLIFHKQPIGVQVWRRFLQMFRSR